MAVAPTESELKRLWVRAADGDRRARDVLVERHLGLVKMIAQRFRGLGLPLEDLVQEGSIGLVEAIDRFDTGRGTAFSTYAFWRIRGAVARAVANQARLVRLPKHVLDRRVAIATAAATFDGEGREPASAELARAAGLPAAAVADALAVPVSMASLDETFEDGAPLGSTIEDPAAVDPASRALERIDAARVDVAVGHLPERHRFVVEHHFGLGHDPETLAEVGAELELSPQRVRAIEQEALFELARELEPAP